MPSGVLRAQTADGHAGRFDAAQCVVQFQADLTLPDTTWALLSVDPTAGRIDTRAVAEAMQAATQQGFLCEALNAAVQVMQH